MTDSYIGNNPISETAGTRSEWAPTNGQTTFTIQYAIGYLDVFVNGSKLASADFTATNGTSFTLNTAVTDQDHVAAIAWAKGGMDTASGVQVYVQGATPTGANDGDFWIDNS